MSDDDHVGRIQSAGRYDAVVSSEEEAKRIVRLALPAAVELPPAQKGEPYPSPPPGAGPVCMTYEFPNLVAA